MPKLNKKKYWVLVSIFVLVIIIILLNVLKKPIIDESILDTKFCEKDDDCVVTSIKKFDCCSVCFIEAINKKAEIERKKWEKQNCEQKDYRLCEYAECVVTPSMYTTVCIDNKCNIKEKLK